MDFFSATTSTATDALAAITSPALLHASPGTHSPTTATTAAPTDAFAEAINVRYSRKSSTLLIPLSPSASPTASRQPSFHTDKPIPAPVLAKAPSAMLQQSNLPADDFLPVTPASLRELLSTTLVIDIRPHNAYALARLPNALSLSVPSTLLKRPLFSLEKLAQMLSSEQAQAKFSQWQGAASILVYDADSGALSESGNLVGLLRKFRKEGFTRKLFWLKGGFKAVWRDAIQFVDQQPLLDDEEASAPPASTPAALLRTTQLPMSAFTMCSTTSSRQVSSTPMIGRGAADPFSLRVPPQVKRISNTNTPTALSASPLFLPTGLPTGQTRSSSMSLHLPLASKKLSTSTIPEDRQLHSFPHSRTSLPTSAASPYDVAPIARPHSKSMPGGNSMAFNPFFDNIRQNLELSGGRGSGEGILLRLPRRVRRRVGELPFEWLRDIGQRSGTLGDDSDGSESESAGKVDSDAAMNNSLPGAFAATGKRSKKQKRSKNTSHAQDRFADSSSSDSNSPPPNSSSVSLTTSTSKASSKAGSTSPPPVSTIDLHPPSPALPTSSEVQPTPHLPHAITAESSENETSGEDLAKVLAMQFYKIELGEQRRMMGIMEHHSKESTTVPLADARSASSLTSSGSGRSMSGGASAPSVQSGPGCFLPPMPSTVAGVMQEESTDGVADVVEKAAFPYSITAGVEKGEKNRYRNIWPFEHARVRLHKARPEDDDYMNASYIQPLGTRKRYIATQGPLPTTFADFWTLCWQENVHVIVMLTREVESALVKCGNYWAEGDYGSLRLKLVSTTDDPDRERQRKDREMLNGFFSFPQQGTDAKKDKTVKNERHTIKRVFELTNLKYPHMPSRMVTQLQYLDWPDLDVPKDPKGLLELMEEVDEIVEGTRLKGDMRWGEGPLKQLPTSTPPEERSHSISTDTVDAATGISHHAAGRAPVLLHCSAGVGRTGGFIAIDAVLDGVRREMRKRRERNKVSHGSGDNSSGSRSSLSSPEGDASMDIDSSVQSPRGMQDGGSTLSVSGGGGNQVHVPVVESGNGQSLMDVDIEPKASSSPPSDDVDVKASGPSGILKPSPALLQEMKGAHAKYHAAAADRETKIGQSPHASTSGASSSTRSGAVTSYSAVSSAHTSTTSFSPSAKPVGRSTGHNRHDDSKPVEARKPSKNPPNLPTSTASATLDSWRTAVSNTQSHASPRSNTPSALPTSLQSPMSIQDTVLANPRGMAFDYMEPRILHGNGSPPLLSTYHEPIRRVIEDMREQRMSLCQSLRQYVFVHRAIIEGALRIVDEEKRREREELVRQRAAAAAEDVEMSLSNAPVANRRRVVSGRSVASHRGTGFPISPTPLRASGLIRVEDDGLGPAIVLEERGLRGSPLSQVVSADISMDASPLSTSPVSPRTKRQASPAELTSEDARGEPRLVKRASVKRRPVTPPAKEGGEGSGTGGMTMGSLMLTSPPSHPASSKVNFSAVGS